MTDPFTDPSSSSGVDWAEFKGSLLLLTVRGLETDVKTSYGTTDAVRADVAVLDGPGSGQEFPDILVFPKILQSQLRRNVGQKVLGRLGQGVAKSGQSAPWQLDAATDSDRDLGRRYLSKQVSSAEPPF